jgi:hypothetical protein
MHLCDLLGGSLCSDAPVCYTANMYKPNEDAITKAVGLSL